MSAFSSVGRSHGTGQLVEISGEIALADVKHRNLRSLIDRVSGELHNTPSQHDICANGGLNILLLHAFADFTQYSATSSLQSCVRFKILWRRIGLFRF
jgi:hypothetical protein